ncbi:MAG: hypothetical protein SVR94_08640, partial [Pseudomonadota bacterium]|nr:hypothetical protein [Pseudomonadota bacterium]
KIIINIDELFNYFNNKQQELHQLSELLSKNKVNVLKLTYEDIFQNEESKVKTIESVFDFLGIDRGHISPSNQKKMLPKKLADKIENYQEVINALKKTKYEHFLDE